MIPVIIEAAIALLQAGPEFVIAAEKLKQIWTTDKGMTTEEWATYDAQRDAMYTEDQWKPDPDPGT